MKLAGVECAKVAARGECGRVPKVVVVAEIMKGLGLMV
jgi:hypothetical protein